MPKISEFIKQKLKKIQENKKGVGLNISFESFSLCVIEDRNNFETAYCESHKFPASVRSHTSDCFSNDRSAQYVFDFIKDFLPQDVENINLALPSGVAKIAVTPVKFAEKDEAIGYARFQTYELFGENFIEPLFSACPAVENVRGKREKTKFIVACSDARNMVMLEEAAEASKINFASAEPVALCALRAYCGLNHGNVLFVFVNLSELFLVLLNNGCATNFYAPKLDVEREGFLDEFKAFTLSIVEANHLEADSLKVKIAGGEEKYKLCETLGKLGIAREISLAQCHVTFASCEEELAFGAAVRH